MNKKQIIFGGLLAAAIIIPKEFLFKPETFLFDMLYNVGAFLLAAIIVGFIFKNKKEVAPEKKETPKITFTESLPEKTKEEDYGKFMPK